jgi:NADH:ubiquinone oxidoreductase subunit 5 (subunit L)/multisubunit Na+/H+ antiporter MnhA subunit
MNPVLIAIFSPFCGAFLVKILPKRQKPLFSIFLLGVTLLLVVLTLPPVIKQGEIISYKYFTDWFSFSFVADGLSVFMALVSSLVAFLISLYSLEYMQEYEERGEFYFWMVLFLGSMMGLVFSANLLLLYCFWEITAVCSWRLIGFYRSEKDTKAADRAFLTTFFGASLMLVGIIFIYLNYGTLDLAFLKDKTISNTIALLLLAGIISKSAQLPLQTWLPEAGVAPTPVTALLHAAVLVKIGVYVFARFFNATFISSAYFLNIAIALSAATIIVGGASALVEKNINRILAYSTISQLGYVILALAFNTAISLKIALVYILAHSLAKAGLFLCAGIIEHKTGTKDITALGGLLKHMPYTATAYLLCAFSIIGLPPFLGFWPKFAVLLSAFETGHIAAGVFAITGALFTLFYLFRLFDKVFLGEEKIKAEEGRNSIMVTIVLVFGILSLLLGLLVKFPINLLGAVLK